MMFYGVIFDLDGTLLNTLEDICDSVNIVLEKHGLPQITLDDSKRFVGNGLRNLVKLALPEENHDLTDACLHEIMEVYRDNCLNKTKPYEGIPEMLAVLKKRDVRMAILSNKQQDLTEKVVNSLLPEGLFSIIYGERHGIPKKPNPMAALQIAELLMFKPKEIIFMGDSNVDIKTARAAGMFSVGAAWGFRGIGELIAAKADTIITDPFKLLNLL